MVNTDNFLTLDLREFDFVAKLLTYMYPGESGISYSEEKKLLKVKRT